MRPAVPLLLGALLFALLAQPPTGLLRAAPATCVIQEGQSIGTVGLGIEQAEMRRLLGTPIGQVAGQRSGETVYLFAAVVSQVTVAGGRVRRVGSGHASCATSQGVGIGDTEAKVRVAYERTVGSLRAAAGKVVRLVYPFDGVEFILTAGRVSLIEIFRAETFRASLPAVPSPTPAGQPAAGVALSQLEARVEGTAVVVSGTVSNAGTPVAAFVQIALLAADGRRLGEGSTPVHPNPVGGGNRATFEVRIAVTEVAARFVVTVRPMNRPSAVLVEATEEIKNVQQFVGVVERQLEVVVLGATLEGRASGTMVAVTNRSALRISNLVLELDMRATCNVQVPPGGVTPVPGPLPTIPPPLPPPIPNVRQMVDQRKGTVQIPLLEPNARVEVPIDLASRGPCVGFGSDWTVTWRIVSARVEAPESR